MEFFFSKNAQMSYKGILYFYVLMDHYIFLKQYYFESVSFLCMKVQ